MAGFFAQYLLFFFICCFFCLLLFVYQILAEPGEGLDYTRLMTIDTGTASANYDYDIENISHVHQTDKIATVDHGAGYTLSNYILYIKL